MKQQGCIHREIKERLGIKNVTNQYIDGLVSQRAGTGVNRFGNSAASGKGGGAGKVCGDLKGVGQQVLVESLSSLGTVIPLVPIKTT